MASQADELADRVKQFAVRVVRLVRSLPHSVPSEALARQLVKSATGESANYRAARRARSRAEFIAKIGIVVEEADESEHWLEVMQQTGIVSGPEFESLVRESHELRAIFVASARTARANLQQSPKSAARKRSSNP